MLVATTIECSDIFFALQVVNMGFAHKTCIEAISSGRTHISNFLSCGGQKGLEKDGD